MEGKMNIEWHRIDWVGWTLLIFAFLLALGFALAVLLPGCATPDKPEPVILTEAGQLEITKWQAKYETATKNLTFWQGVLIISAMGSLVGCFLSSRLAKIGIPLFAACLIGYGLLSAGIYYPEWVALIGLIGGVGVCGYAIWINRAMFRQVVITAEGAKDCLDEDSREKVFGDSKVAIANFVQSKATKKAVKKVREKLSLTNKNKQK